MLITLFSNWEILLGISLDVATEYQLEETNFVQVSEQAPGHRQKETLAPVLKGYTPHDLRW